MAKSKCIFCKIAEGEVENTTLLYDKDELVVFQDRKPASTHHYLVVPRKHTTDAKHLKADDISLVESLVAAGKEVLSKQGGDCSDVRMGFHWPPFHSISHLHLHVISPPANMGWIGRAIFKPDSYWFVTVDWLLERLKNMQRTEEENKQSSVD